MPPATAAMPTMGDSGIISCFSVVAWIGPMSRTFSLRVANSTNRERDEAEYDQKHTDELHVSLRIDGRCTLCATPLAWGSDLRGTRRKPDAVDESRTRLKFGRT